MYPQRDFRSRLGSRDIWFYVALLAFGAAAAGWTVIKSYRAWQLETYGVEAVATVTNMKHRTSRCGNERRQTCHSYELSYRFVDDAGRTVRDKAKVGEGTYNKFPTGRNIRILYVPGRSHVNDFLRGGTRQSSWISLVLSVVSSTIGAFGLQYEARRVRRETIARDSGEMRKAVVTKVEALKSAKSRRDRARMTWKDDLLEVGYSYVHPIGYFPAVGSTITVFALPGRAETTVWEGDIGSRKAAE